MGESKSALVSSVWQRLMGMGSTALGFLLQQITFSPILISIVLVCCIPTERSEQKAHCQHNHQLCSDSNPQRVSRCRWENIAREMKGEEKDCDGTYKKWKGQIREKERIKITATVCDVHKMTNILSQDVLFLLVFLLVHLLKDFFFTCVYLWSYVWVCKSFLCFWAQLLRLNLCDQKCSNFVKYYYSNFSILMHFKV